MLLKPTRSGLSMTSTTTGYCLGLMKQSSDYETTIEYLINYIKKVFDYGNNI